MLKGGTQWPGVVQEGSTGKGLPGWVCSPVVFIQVRRERHEQDVWQEDVLFEDWGVTSLTRFTGSWAVDGSWRQTTELTHELNSLCNEAPFQI